MGEAMLRFVVYIIIKHIITLAVQVPLQVPRVGLHVRLLPQREGGGGGGGGLLL